MTMTNPSVADKTRAPFYKRAFSRAARYIDNALDLHPIASILIVSAFLTLIIEILGRHSLSEGILFMLSHPEIFMCNCLIISMTVALSLLGRKRFVWMLLISLIWLGLGIAECVVLSFRTTPISAIDFTIMLSVLPIINYYLSIFEIILIIAAFIGAVGLIIWLGFKCRPLTSLAFKHRLLICCVFAVVGLAYVFIGRWTGFMGVKFSNIGTAYENYGFPYCFSVSIFDRGIGKPDDYSSDLVQSIVDPLDDENADNIEQPSDMAADRVTPENGDTAVKPNIIFLQLESFFDVNRVRDADFSEDPLPYFTSLKENYPSGFLTVPTIGAGTANVEFEVLSGMSLNFFGAGEYPYKTLLMDQTCETVCYNLKDLGYTTTAIHNNTATFYDRHIVYRHAGFDRFVSLEYMNDVTYTQVGWARDDILTGQTLAALSATEGLDYIFTISVQGHGKYPTEVAEEMEVDVTGFDEEKRVPVKYYVNQLREDDIFLNELTAALSEYDEPVMLVIYGDHLPSFEISDDMLDGCTRFQTEYVIWTNYELEAEDKDLYAYQLSSHVMGLCGYDSGVITKFHQQEQGSADYLTNLEILGYDMLYGAHDAWGGVNPYAPTDIKFGLDTIRVTDVQMIGDDFYISGDDFTVSSVIYADGEALKTVFINEHALMCENYECIPGSEISVHQVTNDYIDLSQSNAVVYTPKAEYSSPEFGPTYSKGEYDESSAPPSAGADVSDDAPP